MSEAYDSLIEGLNEALAFARGETTGAIVHRVEVPEVDVAAIRASTGLSQGAFARSIGVAKGHPAQLGTRPSPPDRPRASAAGDDRAAAVAGGGIFAVGLDLTIRTDGVALVGLPDLS